MKKSIFLAVAAVAMTACSNDVDLGMKDANKQTADNAIGFEVRNSNMSRAQNLQDTKHYNFGVFAYKNVATNPAIMENYLVGYFGTNVGYKTTSSDQTTSDQTTIDQSLWAYEKLGYLDYTYAGTDGHYIKDNIEYMSNIDHQYLRYWDHSTSWTNFYGYAPYINGSNTVTFDNKQHKMIFANGTIKAGIDDPSQFEYLYVAKNVAKGQYNAEVPLAFKHLNSKIRITFWEDIAGYSVKLIDLKDSPNVGISAAPATEGTPNYTYADIAKTASAEFEFSGATYTDYPTITASNYTLTTKYMGISDKDDANFGNNEYIEFKTPTADPIASSKAAATENPLTNTNYSTTVYYGIPKTAESGLTFHVSFVLKNEQTQETITVKDARVFVAGKNCKWEAGKQYTYVFRITKNATGTTDNPRVINPGDPNPGTQALYPIIFDGITVEDWVTPPTESDHDIN